MDEMSQFKYQFHSIMRCRQHEFNFSIHYILNWKKEEETV